MECFGPTPSRVRPTLWRLRDWTAWDSAIVACRTARKVVAVPFACAFLNSAFLFRNSFEKMWGQSAAWGYVKPLILLDFSVKLSIAGWYRNQISISLT
jgi:hypothetical protein